MFSWEFAAVHNAWFLLGALFLVLLRWKYFQWKNMKLSLWVHRRHEGTLLQGEERRFFHQKTVLVSLAWIFAIIALMEPRGNPHYLEAGLVDGTSGSTKQEQEVFIQRKAHDVVFLLDASASMEVTDTRTGISRFEYAKEIIDETISQMQDETVSLFAFTSEVSTVSPPTMDQLYVRLMLRNVSINEGDVSGTDLLEALDVIRSRYFISLNERMITLVLLSDAGDTRLEGASSEQRTNEITALLGRIQGTDDSQLKVFTVGLGSKEGAEIPGIEFQGKSVRSKLDEELLQKLSDSGKGRYYYANSFSSLAIAASLSEHIHTRQTTANIEEESVVLQVANNEEPPVIYDEYFRYPLFLAFLMLLLYLMPWNVLKITWSRV